MVQITSFFAILSLAAAGLGSAIVLKRDAGTVEADLGVLAGLATTLDNAIIAFPLTGGTVDSALAIHNNATNFISGVNVATSDALAAGAFSEADGLAILNGAPSLSPLFDALQGIIDKKAALDALPVTDIDAIILQDLQSAQSSLAAFGNALISDFPADLKAQATALRDNIVNAFVPAINAYSS
ncbi:hydrophobic surface binding protein [Mycena rebaudengoi]|nr:hydrophobic surface binding protein [Mycena rebaudengoi]